MSVENLEGEIWKVIDHPSIGCYPNYMVSNMGRVKSLNYRGNTGTEKLLKQSKNRDSYFRSALSKKGKRRYFFTHRLVGLLFIPNPNNLLEINHLDENKSNNAASNLCWVSRKENINYGTGVARSVASRKTSEAFKKAQKKRVEKKMRQVFQYTNDGTLTLINVYESVRETERQTGFSSSNISKCCRGEKNSFKGFIWRYEPIETSSNQLTLFPITTKKIS